MNSPNLAWLPLERYLLVQNLGQSGAIHDYSDFGPGVGVVGRVVEHRVLKEERVLGVDVGEYPVTASVLPSAFLGIQLHGHVTKH